MRIPDGDIYRKLLETAPDAIIVIDSDGRIVLANAQTDRMFGYARGDLIGQPVELLVPERLRAGHRTHRQGYAHAPSARPMGVGMALIARTRSGTEFPAEISLSPVDAGGAGYVSAAIRDASGLQSAREGVARAHYQAHVVELGQRVIAARELDEIAVAVPSVAARALQADVILLYLLAPGDTEFVCRAAYGVPEALMPAYQRLANNPQTSPGFVMAAGDTVTVMDYTSETRFDPGPMVPVLGLRSALGVPIMGDGGPVGVLAARFRDRRVFSEDDKNFMRSVSNILGAAIKYTHAEERMRHVQQLEAVGQLTGGIAHDFNNLLTVIIGNLQLLQEDAPGDEALAQPVEAALRAATNAADLTRKLLAFSRRQALRPRPVDVNELVGGMLDMIRRTLGERITILAFPDPNVPQAHADPSQLETALLNLVVNARDAMPRGGRLSIETAVRVFDEDYAEQAGDVKPGRYVMIAVTDNGMGMPAEVVQRAFDPYFTTKERGKGSGLGLSMVHGFVKQSHGHVTIYSEPGHGTTVRLFLPIAAEARVPVQTPSGEGLPRGHETILMVEDDEGVRAIGARFLTQLGYKVYEAGDADTALRLLEQHPEIELLFTDIVLPGRHGGVELAREVQHARPDLAFVFTSGYASGAFHRLEKLPGALIDKPYRREALAMAVRAAIDRRPRS
ncbi:MAG: PAS domain S-box protein [Burkholderiales bacterium]|nr:PAS domain S-box protein [Burkholderiales bacterium]